MAGTTRTIGWDEIDSTDRFLIDVRTHGEHRRGHIEGSVNISVDDLRARHTEIPRDASGQPGAGGGVLPGRPARAHRGPAADPARATTW